MFDDLTLVTTALLPLDDEEENDNDEDIGTGNNDNANTSTTTSIDDNNNNNNIDFHPRIVFSTTNLDAYMQCNSQVWLAVRNRLLSLFVLDDVIIATAATAAVDTTTNSNDDDDDDSNDAAKTASIANNAKSSSSSRRRRRMTTSEILIRPDNRLQNNPPLQQAAFHPLSTVRYHLPCTIGDYTDFYSSREHATNVGSMFRGKEDALQPNWLHCPIGYHGRCSSIHVGGSSSSTEDDVNTTTDYDDDDDDDMRSGRSGRRVTVRRPCGQLQLDSNNPKKGSIYGPTKSLDFELEVAFLVGGGGGGATLNSNPLTISEARKLIFGYVLLNDWSARDIQKWEYVPLGPFTSKNFATTISPWIISPMALEPYWCETSAIVQGGGGGGDNSYNEDPIPLDYLQDSEYGSYNVHLSASIQPAMSPIATIVCQSNLRNMYWSSVQQLVHHSVTGCPIRTGDMLASGTISGTQPNSFGSMLELSWGGTRDVKLDGDITRQYIEDGDTVIMKGWCGDNDSGSGGGGSMKGPGRVGFGSCAATILPAIPFPYDTITRKEPSAGLDRFTQFQLRDVATSSSTSLSWSRRVRIALSAKRITHKTILLPHDQHSPPVLEFVDRSIARRGGDSSIVRITQIHAIFEFLDSSFPNQGGQLLPPDPLARASAIEVAEIIDSINYWKSAGGDVSTFTKCNAFRVGLASLELLLMSYHTPPSTQPGVSISAGGGPFAIGTFGPNLADIWLIPLLHDTRLLGIDTTVYSTLTSIEMACQDHPWFLGSAD